MCGIQNVSVPLSCARPLGHPLLVHPLFVRGGVRRDEEGKGGLGERVGAEGGAPKVQNLKPSYLDAQWFVMDDTAVEMLSTRSIVLEDQEGNKLHEQENIIWRCFFRKFAKSAKLKTFITRRARVRFR